MTESPQDKIKELDGILSGIRAFRKQAFQPMPMPQGGQPPMDPAMMGGAPPMDPAMAQGGMPPVDPNTGMPMDPAMMDPAMAGGAPPMDPAMAGGATPPIPPELEQALADMMGSMEQLAMVVEQQKQQFDRMAASTEESTRKIIELETQVKGLEKALGSQAPYEEPQPSEEEMMAMMGGGGMGGGF